MGLRKVNDSRKVIKDKGEEDKSMLGKAIKRQWCKVILVRVTRLVIRNVIL